MAVRTKRFIGKNKSCSCSMPGVWRAAAFCDGFAVIFHSPRACAHVARSMDINAHYRSIAAGYGEYLAAVPLVSSQLKEKHSIFGGAERLKQCIRWVVEKYNPQCIVIANSCVAGVIGDDVESVGIEAEMEFNLPVITVNTYGFLDGEYYEGYFEVAKKMMLRFCNPQKFEKGTALLLGDNGGPWGSYAREVTRLLNELNIKVIGQFPGYTAFNDLPYITRAQACIVLGGRGQTHIGLTKLAQIFKDKYNMDYLPGKYPVGWTETKDWIKGIGDLFNCREEAAALILKENLRLNKTVEKFLPVTEGIKTVICIGRWLMYFNPAWIIQIAERIKLSVIGIVLLPGYNEQEKNLMLEAVQKCCNIPVYENLSDEGLMEQVQLILTTHELQGTNVKQIFLPMLPTVGTTGEMEFIQLIYRTLCSKNRYGGIVYG